MRLFVLNLGFCYTILGLTFNETKKSSTQKRKCTNIDYETIIEFSHLNHITKGFKYQSSICYIFLKPSLEQSYYIFYHVFCISKFKFLLLQLLIINALKALWKELFSIWILWTITDDFIRVNVSLTKNWCCETVYYFNYSVLELNFCKFN